MRLTELHPQFLSRINDNEFKEVDDISQADGITFLCPVCFRENNGPVGTHSIVCWQPNVPQTTFPTPGRWAFLGTGYEDLELHAGSSSIFLNKSKCQAHFFIRNGNIE